MGLFFYTKIGSIISIGDLPTTNIIEPSLLEMLNQLHGTTPEADAELKEFLKDFKG